MRQMQVVDHQGSPQTNLSSITYQILFSEGGKYLHQKKKKKPLCSSMFHLLLVFCVAELFSKSI